MRQVPVFCWNLSGWPGSVVTLVLWAGVAAAVVGTWPGLRCESKGWVFAERTPLHRGAAAVAPAIALLTGVVFGAEQVGFGIGSVRSARTSVFRWRPRFPSGLAERAPFTGRLDTRYPQDNAFSLGWHL